MEEDRKKIETKTLQFERKMQRYSGIIIIRVTYNCFVIIHLQAKEGEEEEEMTVNDWRSISKRKKQLANHQDICKIVI